MRGVLALVVCTGCELVFPLDATTFEPPPKRPLGCSPMSMFSDDFARPAGPLGRPWVIESVAGVKRATIVSQSVLLDIADGDMRVSAEPYLDIREQEASVIFLHSSVGINLSDRAMFELLSEDGRLRVSFGAVVRDNLPSTTDLVAEAVELDEDGNESSTITIGTEPDLSTLGVTALVIRQQGAVTTFLSGNGIDAPTTRFTRDLPPLALGFVRPSLFVRAAETESQWQFDSVNAGAPPVGDACPATTLGETFDGPLSTDWQRADQNECDIVEDAGGDLRMQFTADPDVAHRCALETSTYYNLRDQAVELTVKELAASATSTDLHLRFLVQTRTSRGGFEVAFDGQLTAVFDKGDTKIAGEAPFDPALHKRWRLSGTSRDQLIWEVSPSETGEDFVPFGETQPGDVGSLDAVRLLIIHEGNGDEDNRATFGEIRSR